MNSSSTKPFESKTFFLDLSSYPYSAKLSKDLVHLGAKEVFSIPSASFVVSDRPNIKAEDISGPRSNSPLFRDSTLDCINSPVVHSPSFDQKNVMERVKPMSRGLSILMKANEKTQGANHKKDAILDLCKRWNIKIYPLQKVLNFIEKYKIKHHKVRSSKKKYESEDVCKIAPPYIKIEDAKREFRPKYKTLVSPKIVDSFLFKCVKNLIKNTKQSTDVKVFARPVLQEMSVMSQISKNELRRIEPVSITKPLGLQSMSISNSLSICTPSTVVKEGRKNQAQTKTKKEKKKSKKEYCEICRVHYTNADVHFEREGHKKFLENSENYAELEELISKLPTVKDFLAKIEAEEQTKEVCTDELQLFEGPISVESCSNKGSGVSLKPNDGNGSMTERYSLREDEIISSSCSCPSTPLPYLQERETVNDRTFSDHNKMNERSLLTNQGIFSQESQVFDYNSFMAGSKFYESSRISDSLHSKCVHQPNLDNDYSSQLKLSCDNLTGVMCPAQRINRDDFYFGKKQINMVECPSKTLLTAEESLNNCEYLFLPTDYYTDSVTPLDLSYNPVSVNAQDILENSFGITANIAHSNAYSVTDITGTYTGDNLHCMTDDINITAVDLTIPAATINVDAHCGNFKPVPALMNSFNIEDQVNDSNYKIGNVDSNTEIYSSETEFDDESLNKIVASCIEEVDKDLENNSPTMSNDLNNKHEMFCFDTPNLKSPDSLNVSPVKVTMTDASSVKQTGIHVMDISLGCNSTVNAESSNARDFGEYDAEAMSPPSKKMRFHSQSSPIPKETVEKSYQQSSVHEQELISAAVQTESDVFSQEMKASISPSNANDLCEYFVEDRSPPSKKIRLQLENSLTCDKPDNELFVLKNVQEQVSLQETKCFQCTNSVAKAKRLTLPFFDESGQSNELGTTVNVSEIEKGDTLNSNKIDVHSNDIDQPPKLEPEISFSYKINKSSNVVTLPDTEKVNVVYGDTSNSNNIDVHSEDNDQPPKLEPEISFPSDAGKVNDFYANTLNSKNINVNLNDIDQPPKLEPLINFPFETNKDSDELVLSNTNKCNVSSMFELANSDPSKVISDAKMYQSSSKEIDTEKPIVLETSVIRLPFMSEKNSKVTCMLELDNVSSDFYSENLILNSLSNKSIQNVCWNSNNEHTLDLQNKHLISEDSYNYINCTAENFTHDTSKGLYEIQKFISNIIDDVEKISKAIEISNISPEEFDQHHVFIVLDEASDDSVSMESLDDSSDIQNIKSESCYEQSDQVKNSENVFGSVSHVAKETDITYNVVNDQIDCPLDIYKDSKEKSDVNEEELQQVNKLIYEEVKACMNALTHHVEKTLMKTVVIDNTVNYQMDYISTVNLNYDLEEKYVEANTEQRNINICTIPEEINACMYDLIKDIEITNEREIAVDDDTDCLKREEKRASFQNINCVDKTADFVNQNNFYNCHSDDVDCSDYIRSKIIFDKEIKIIIPKLTVVDIKQKMLCNKEVKVVIPKLTVDDCLYLSSCEKDDDVRRFGLAHIQKRKISINNNGIIHNETLKINFTPVQDCNTFCDVSLAKNTEDSDSVTLKQKTLNKESKIDEIKTSEDDSSEMDSDYNITKVGYRCKTLPLQAQYFRSVSDTSKVNASINESSNSSGDRSSGNLSESINSAYDFCSAESSPNSSDVEKKAMNILYINSSEL